MSAASSEPRKRRSHSGPRDALRRYFERNPGDQLTIEDAMLKLDLTRQQVLVACAALRTVGYVQTMHIIAAGPQVPGSVAHLEAARRDMPPGGSA